MSPDVKITLALTHFERAPMLLECVAQVINDPRIGEIVIHDDASRDGSYKKLCERFKEIPEVYLYQNERNIDCHRNKRNAVLQSTYDWVILFDSDNILRTDYLDCLYALERWDSHIVYCPEFAEPHFDYTAFAGKTVNRCNVAQFMQKKNFATALNTCNYFVNREAYLETWDGKVNPHTADSIYQALCWLKAGNAIHIVPGLRYFHRVHDKSHFKLNVHKTGNFAKEVEAKLRGMF